MGKITGLFLAIFSLISCTQGAVIGSADSAAVSRFDGKWAGNFDSRTPVGTNGAPCVDSEASGTITNGNMKGQGVTEYGTYMAWGTIHADGTIEGKFELGRFVGEFTGKADGDDVFTGEFRDAEDCQGVWRMEKV